MEELAEPRPRAVLVGVQLPAVSDAEHESALLELGRLVKTLGYEVMGTVTQRREALSPVAVLGEGKLAELAGFTGGTGEIPGFVKSPLPKARERFEEEEERVPVVIDELPEGERASLVVVDHELTPRQVRNLERATGAEVLDRTFVIVEIFHRHAKTREARLQVEIARLSYVSPRMRESTGRRERQQGRGAGESLLELDRRRIRDRLAELRKELEAIADKEGDRREARQRHLRVALVGYTNAGKSSLMRALTQSTVLVEDKLFATLDTTVRALCPETRPKILVSDTVGFIKKLPHELVASFRSTLEEAKDASLIVLVADGSDPACDEQLLVTREVLREIGADTVPQLLVLNKADRLTSEVKEALSLRHPEGLLLSARSEADVTRLHQAIVARFESTMLEASFTVPYAEQGKLSELYENGRVLEESYDEAGVKLRVRALPEVVARLRQRFG